MNDTRTRQPRDIIGSLTPAMRMCTTKRVYSKRDAVVTANRFNRLLNPGESRMNIYKCPFCRSWHVGHTSSALNAAAG